MASTQPRVSVRICQPARVGLKLGSGVTTLNAGGQYSRSNLDGHDHNQSAEKDKPAGKNPSVSKEG